MQSVKEYLSTASLGLETDMKRENGSKSRFELNVVVAEFSSSVFLLMVGVNGMAAGGVDEELLQDAYQRIVDGLFSKCFDLKKETTETLSYECMLHRLAAIDSAVNSLKVRKLNLKVQIPSDQLCKWRRHTWLTNPTKKVPFHLSHAFDLEYCTKAFLKLYEILHRFPNLIPPVPRLGKPFSYVDSLSSVVSLSSLIAGHNRSLHLCEAPGAFISAINVYTFLYREVLRKSWVWYANSLNPHYEWNEPCSLFLDDELITATYDHWIFGPDNSGDILNWDEKYVNSMKLSTGGFDFITADGSLYCQDDPLEQESLTLPLIRAEVEIALRLLLEEGSFVVKMYAITKDETVRILLNLVDLFRDVHVFKPSCSKPGNSEPTSYSEKVLLQRFLYIKRYSRAVLRSTEGDAAVQSDDFYHKQRRVIRCKSFTLFIHSMISHQQSQVLQKFENFYETDRMRQVKPEIWLTSLLRSGENNGVI
ncbi:unnamed protein product [Enterobius vermicularis]|uniref:Cap-specific mRNA (nucleoside-2'-O-)-methyltransferase 2 n=1 Tax=Enterobius vermicularis TaxID=51028 RepID=A0A0N4UVT9_ENTVE|nr:unnamed protein product [Enterobius vermicularis]